MSRRATVKRAKILRCRNGSYCQGSAMSELSEKWPPHVKPWIKTVFKKECCKELWLAQQLKSALR